MAPRRACGRPAVRLDGTLLREAAARVTPGELVLGPANDGALLAETRGRFAGAGVGWHELPVLRDVDTADDARAEGLLT